MAAALVSGNGASSEPYLLFEDNPTHLDLQYGADVWCVPLD
jgi:hypothetical protein